MARQIRNADIGRRWLPRHRSHRRRRPRLDATSLPPDCSTRRWATRRQQRPSRSQDRRSRRSRSARSHTSSSSSSILNVAACAVSVRGRLADRNADRSGDKDRRPLSPPLIVKLVARDRSGANVKLSEVDLCGTAGRSASADLCRGRLIATCDLWDAAGTAETNYASPRPGATTGAAGATVEQSATWSRTQPSALSFHRQYNSPTCRCHHRPTPRRRQRNRRLTRHRQSCHRSTSLPCPTLHRRCCGGRRQATRDGHRSRTRADRCSQKRGGRRRSRMRGEARRWTRGGRRCRRTCDEHR